MQNIHCMNRRLNPFVTGGYISQDYFCDREIETQHILKTIENGNNLAIISPRRMGKTGLIEHSIRQPKLSNNYYCFFIDIYATSNLKEFVYLLGKQIFEALKPKGKQFFDGFFQIISSFRPAFKIDAFSGEPIFDIGMGEIKEGAFTLEEIFKYLEQADKPCIVAIDEFQQIAKYPESNTEALLRTHIQKCKNANFIFAGSERHLMENIFSSASRPFYQSVNLLQLKAIPEDKYSDFVIYHFSRGEKRIDSTLIKRIYQKFEGHTWYIQNLFNEVYSLVDKGEDCTLEIINSAIHSKIFSYEPMFESTLTLLTDRQKEVLFAIAKESKAYKVTSSNFVKNHGLQSASSVQTAVRQLLDKEIISFENDAYFVYDRFFGLWLSSIFGIGRDMELFSKH